ncbi:MAG: ParB/RepB/Spo0J family partition protein [Planktomarina sp.]
MSDSRKKQRGLGRGLSALMADIEPGPTQSMPERSGQLDRLVPIEQITPNPDQPRRTFVEQDLQDLSESIRSKGIIQPLIVRPHPTTTGSFQIVAGERRWRAAQLAQLHELPVVVREFSDRDVLEIAIIENIQRSDLNPIEEALGFKQLMEKFGHTQEQMAEALGKSRPYIANGLRLLNLPTDIQDLVVGGRLSSGHARALITAENASALAQIVVAKGLSVRETEKLVKQGLAPKQANNSQGRVEKDADTKALEGDLSAALKMLVTVDHNAGQDGGSVTIRYKTLEQLDDLCRLLSGG